MSNTIKVGLLGFGTVGTGVLRIIKAHSQKIEKTIGQTFDITKVLVRQIEKYQNNEELAHITLTTNIDDILNDASIDMVVEVMGSVDIARDYIIRALKAKKHVVTANKDLIALHGDELMKLAGQQHCDLYYEASVAGGIPILRTLVNSMASDEIKEVVGIVNGTTNYMLTKMTENGLSYQEALAQAQALGFAEANPSSDVDGLDAARKMVILTRLAFGMQIDLDDITTTGITQIDREDIQNAKQLGYVIKLLGTAKEIDEKVYVEVGPVLIKDNHPLSNVQNENNAVFVVGAAVGKTMYYGPGAGELPTANSVVSDMINIAKNMTLQTTGNIFSHYSRQKALLPKEKIKSPYYFRLNMLDETGRFLEMTKIFAEAGASFAKVKQDQVNNDIASIMIITHPMSVDMYDKIMDKLSQYEAVTVKLAMKVLEN
ncbi:MULTISPECIES: homoserine dehydrogenase [unclassified Granulicatella]|uniref:homoserine dehydrogenase n=1 Tax=unclassified Granulicatella TaxID=2630493 RepID=UPI0010742E90|nr:MULTISPECIES: homoserine dehydrogenase [unclassified Granulicatella]MBF0781124.1 homoserine dehydrogenase [Granulicatella sp. 19428wC4_WM01]TFU91938.1 homoserine dehydrogenase [Granulicatella sp. WM01]